MWRRGPNKNILGGIGFASLNTLVPRSQVLRRCLVLSGNWGFSFFKCKRQSSGCACARYSRWYLVRNTNVWEHIVNLQAQTRQTLVMGVSTIVRLSKQSIYVELSRRYLLRDQNFLENTFFQNANTGQTSPFWGGTKHPDNMPRAVFNEESITRYRFVIGPRPQHCRRKYAQCFADEPSDGTTCSNKKNPNQEMSASESKWGATVR